MRKIQFIGISNGKVGSCLSCEHCYDLQKGVAAFDLGGVTFCEDCILSSDYTEAEVKEIKKDKKWHHLPKEDDTLLTFTVGKQEVRVKQTFKIKSTKDETSVADKFKIVLVDKNNQEKESIVVELNDLVPEFISFISDRKLELKPEEIKQHFEIFNYQTEPYYKSFKSVQIDELMDIIKP